MMQTEAGRKMAEQRLQALFEFRRQFCQEWLTG